MDEYHVPGETAPEQLHKESLQNFAKLDAQRRNKGIKPPGPLTEAEIRTAFNLTQKDYSWTDADYQIYKEAFELEAVKK